MFGTHFQYKFNYDINLVIILTKCGNWYICIYILHQFSGPAAMSIWWLDLVLPWHGLKAASQTSRAILKPSQAAVNGFGLQWLGSGLKWLQVAFSGWSRGFVPDLARVCLSPVGGDDRLEHIYFCMVLAHVTRRTNMW